MPAELNITFSLLETLAASLEVKAAVIVTETAQEVVTRAQERIEDPDKSGHVYVSKTKPSPHQASAPGEAPANWTGALKESITYVEEGPLEAIVTVGEEYAHKLEFGDQGGRMAARPFLQPTVDELQPVFEARMARLLETGE